MNYSEVLFYAENKILSKEKLESYVSGLPVHMRNRIAKFRYKEDTQNFVIGKILLSQTLDFFGLDLKLNSIKYNKHNRPYFESQFDFNISHSGNLVVCIASEKHKVGIDVEAIYKIDIDYYKNIFSPKVWNVIIQSEKSLECFYYYWTNHEAVLKAQGSGLPDVHEIIYQNSEITYFKKICWFTKEIFLRPGYQCHIASNVSNINLLKRFIEI